jgi:hypothetical protein
MAALTLADVALDSVTVNQAVWNGLVSTPKTQSAFLTIAVSPQVATMLSEQIERQKVKGHSFLFATLADRTRDMNLFRKRKTCFAGNTAGRVSRIPPLQRITPRFATSAA